MQFNIKPNFVNHIASFKYSEKYLIENVNLIIKINKEKEMKILIVDDNYLNQKVAALFLKEMGYDADIATSGEEAIGLFSENTYALILMDVGLPEMDGIEATRQIRALEEGSGKRIPIIAATAYGDICHQQCLDAGMDDVLTKPLMMDVFKTTLDKYVPLKPDNKTSHQ